nr:spiro-SPASM protein [Spirochaeta sp.]
TDVPAKMPELLLTHPVIRRTRPYYYQVQITTAMVQRPMYTPWGDSRWVPASSSPDDGGPQPEHIPLERWNTILDKIAAETPEATIAIGYRGDPGCHPALPELIRSAEAHPGVDLYIETAGIGWSEVAIQALSSPAVAAVIVELDTNVPETYETLRGPRREEAVAFTDRLAATMPGRVYVQATRMRENEWELQEFYQTWNAKEGVTVIIQKHNSFAGKIADRRVADLSPLERPPCRHLERDMAIRIDGEVPRCFQDLDMEQPRGSLLKDSLATIWERGESEFEEHTRGVYSPMCRECDEYYTFNA